MDTVSDVINIGDTGRMHAWVFSIGLAILGVLGLSVSGLSEISLISINDTANPPYVTANFAWPRHILGGFIVALVVVAAWWVTTGELGQTLLEDADMMNEKPFAIGAQSFTFSQPPGHFLRWIETGFSLLY